MCDLCNIRLMCEYPEAFEVDRDGIRTIMVERPPAYTPAFTEYYCIVHDCTFKQWGAVLSHLEGG